MPAPVTVTPDQVAAAAATLAEQGKPITGWTLRGIIGSGRPDRLFSVWRERQGTPEPAAPAPSDDEERGLPPGCPPHVLAMVEDWAADMRRHLDGLAATMWQAASLLADQERRAEVDRLDGRVRELERELGHAAYQVESLEGMVQGQWNEAQAQKDDAAIQVAGARAEVKQARTEADGHREANVRLQATLDELVRRLPAVEQPEVA